MSSSRQPSPLPNDPIEPWLLTKKDGPFMVLAKTFRGPDSEKLALLLAKELRAKYNLPAYILRSKDFPGKSNIRGIPPQADPGVVQANVNVPEKIPNLRRGRGARRQREDSQRLGNPAAPGEEDQTRLPQSTCPTCSSGGKG